MNLKSPYLRECLIAARVLALIGLLFVVDAGMFLQRRVLREGLVAQLTKEILCWLILFREYVNERGGLLNNKVNQINYWSSPSKEFLKQVGTLGKQVPERK
jgi:hypothetical protein